MLIALCSSADAQQPKKMSRIGYLTASADAATQPREEALLKGLRELGYIPGQNIVVERRITDDSEERFAQAALELAQFKVDCIVTSGTAGTLAAKRATSTIPIVMVNVGDAVERGFVASLARPGGNITGFTTSSPDLADKRLELLKETFPKISRVAIFWDPLRLGTDAHVQETEVAARALKVQLQVIEVRRAEDIENAYRTAAKVRADALIVAGAGFGRERAKILDLAIRNHLPVMYSDPRFVTAGGSHELRG